MKCLSLVALCLVMGVATQACSSNYSTTSTASPTTETSAKPAQSAVKIEQLKQHQRKNKVFGLMYVLQKNIKKGILRVR